MCGKHLTFSTPKSQAVLQAMRDRLGQSAATIADLAKATGKSRYTVMCYLAHLRDEDEVVCVEEAYVQPKCGSAPAVWALSREDAPQESAVATEDDEVDRFPRKVVVRQQWEPCHQRMAMDCYLFGVPSVLIAEAA